jgi:hypothetical protein
MEIREASKKPADICEFSRRRCERAGAMLRFINDLKAYNALPQEALFSTTLAPRLLGNSRSPLAIALPNLLFSSGLSDAGVAQLVEHLICNQRVGGSNPSASSTRNGRGVRRTESRHDNMNGLVSSDTSPFCVFIRTALLNERSSS